MKLVAKYPELPEGYFWKKERDPFSDGNFISLRKATPNGFGVCILSFERNPKTKLWSVGQPFRSRKLLAKELTAQEAVDFAYATFMLGLQE